MNYELSVVSYQLEDGVAIHLKFKIQNLKYFFLESYYFNLNT